MPGQSSFIVPPSTFTLAWPPVNTVVPANQFQRGVPMPDSNAPSGSVATCQALESMTPPTLRTAYSIYSLSIAWALDFGELAADPGLLLVEIALLISGEVKWVGTDSGTTSPTSTATFYVTNGVINADLVNPVIINPRESLTLRVGGALGVNSTPNAGGEIVGTAYVGEQLQLTPSLVPVPVPQQSTINYQIIDLPGTRSL